MVGVRRTSIDTGRWEYLEHFTLLVAIEPFVLDAYDHLIFEHGSIFLREQLPRCLPLHLPIPDFLICEPEAVRMRNRKREVGM